MNLPHFSSLASTSPRFRGDASAAPALRRWAMAGAIAGGLLTLIACAPAAWLAQGLASATDGRIQLQQARGTLWNGSAHLLLTGGQDSLDQSTLPTRLNWRLGLGLTAARITVQSDCCTSAPVLLKLVPGWNAMTVFVSNSVMQLPASILSGLGTPWNTIALQGQLRLSTTGLVLQYRSGRTSSQGLTQLEALAVSSRLSPLKPLGSYRLDIQGGDNPVLHLSTISGDLKLIGQGQWVGSRLHFNGEASASSEREAALSNLLNILGRRQGSRSIITFG